MSDVSVIGLGLMGAALARALLKGGRAVTVWNRTASRAGPLIAAGATLATNAAGAIAASPITIICVDTYNSAKAFLDMPEARSALAGKTIVQLSTGTPQEARASEPWFGSQGATYLDGAIMGYPEHIGTSDGLVLFAGKEEAYERYKGLLAHLGGHQRYLGPKIGAAAALDFALLTRELGSIIGALHAANICKAEGIGADVLASMILKGDAARAAAKVIHDGSYAETGATIRTWAKAAATIRQHARDLGINDEVPGFILDLHERALAQGLGEEDIAAIVKVLRAGG